MHCSLLVVAVVIVVVVILFFLLLSSLLGWLLLLLLVLALGVDLGQRLLEDLQNLFIRDLLVRLPLRDVWLWWRGNTLETVLGDC